MASIITFLNKILSARKGEDVRGAIHDSIEAINQEVITIGKLFPLKSISLSDKSINTQKIDTGAVTNEKLDNSSVSSAKIQNDAVTSDKIADSSIRTEHLVDKAISESKIQAGAVTQPKIKDESVSPGKIEPSSVKDRVLVTMESGGKRKVSWSQIYNWMIGEKTIALDRLALGEELAAWLAVGMQKQYMPVYHCKDTDNPEGWLVNWCRDTGIYIGGLKKDCGGHPPVTGDNHTSWVIAVYSGIKTAHGANGYDHRMQIAYDTVNALAYIRRGWVSSNEWSGWVQVGKIADGSVTNSKLAIFNQNGIYEHGIYFYSHGADVRYVTLYGESFTVVNFSDEEVNLIASDLPTSKTPVPPRTAVCYRGGSGGMITQLFSYCFGEEIADGTVTIRGTVCTAEEVREIFSRPYSKGDAYIVDPSNDENAIDASQGNGAFYDFPKLYNDDIILLLSDHSESGMFLDYRIIRNNLPKGVVENPYDSATDGNIPVFDATRGKPKTTIKDSGVNLNELQTTIEKCETIISTLESRIKQLEDRLNA